MEFIKLSLEEELAVVTIDRPKSLNALNSQVYREIIATLRQVEAMDQVKVVILTGAGEKAFAAGADIAQMVHEDAVAGLRLSGLCHEAANLLESMRQVTIAAVNGFALGGGCELTLACDLGKGALPVALALWLGLSPLLVTCVALACVLGHVFSCFMGFRGGKAVATSIGVFLPLAFFPLLFSCAACVLVIWRSGFVSLGSLTLVTVLPFALLAATKYAWVPLSLCIWALVVWKHKENIARLRAGTEKSWLKSRQK